ncbi:anti-phage dCTP deaminase [Vibrio parahaemolyticus]|nr:deoxycytidylate deaminase [Vibrio parahaemolyticus]EIJ2831264.1 deoxycytidylate deaminase [Vibrio parahaemolyticus]EJG1831086.1 deoxycytidylate deaminase [Vibrio parahaemolyticus]HAS6949763.1 deoxycytidylate deaminase [Vibrio parahaemolyticus]
MSKSSSARKLESVPDSSTSDKSNKDIQDTIQERRSRELVIGLCGAIGSGVKALKENLIHQLESSGYKTVHIRISDIIADRTEPTLKDLTGYIRYEKLQDNGDLLREKYRNSILAACAIEEIALARSQVCEEITQEENDDNVLKTKEKIAYIIDQLKHPDEVKLLRSVYPRNFYLIGLIRTETERRLNLEEEKIKDTKIDELIRRDRKSVKNGQQVEKTLYNADYFIHNVHNHSQLLEKSVDRFIKLVHDVNGMTPTIDEIGMHSAYSASLRSACLSRQVGAAISDDVGNIIATGCNDVPSFSGGLYNSSSTKDFRCVHRGQCSNDKHKALLREEIKEILTQKIDNGNVVKGLVEDITSNTKIDSLIEYSRAVHAEMDAIVSLARSIRQSSVGMTLYSTTYPCHNCARHIVAAGILRVVYIEPYEKSLALKLHDDALTDTNCAHKVTLAPFEGVSPRRFEAFFRQNAKRKNDEGRVIRVRIHDSYHADSEFIDNYPEMEAKVAESVNKTFATAEAIQ